MDGLGCPADGKACICATIAMCDGTEGCNEELQAIYDQIFDMATEGGKILEEKGPEMFVHGKPTLRVTVEDGKPVMQILVAFTQDPFTDYLNVDSRYLRTLEAKINWAHTIDEVLKEEGEEIDLMEMEGLNAECKVSKCTVQVMLTAHCYLCVSARGRQGSVGVACRFPRAFRRCQLTPRGSTADCSCSCLWQC